MTGEQLLYAGLAALAVLQVAMLAWLLATAGRPSDDGRRMDDTRAETTERSAGGDTVACPRCETVNERGYRYCQACVAELPGADGRTGWLPAPQRGSVP